MLEKNPTVSVIIPTYNRAHLIERAIQSVLNQTYQDFEIIIVDDGSTDNTEEVIKEFQEKDKRVRYIKHNTNKGGNTARNTGLKSIKGEYVAFLDSDDEWLPKKIEKQLEVFKNSKDRKLGFVYCGAFFIKEDSKEKITEILPKKRGYLFKELLERNCITGGGSSNLIKKEVFEKCGNFDECEELRKGGAQEYEMWIRIAKNYDFDFVNECLIKYTVNLKGTTASSKLENKGRAYEYIVNKFFEEYKKYPKILSNKLRWIGSFYCRGSNLEVGRKLFLKSIKYNPLNIKSYLYWLISFFGSNFYNRLYNLTVLYRGDVKQRLINKILLLKE